MIGWGQKWYACPKGGGGELSDAPKYQILQFFFALLKKGWVKPMLTEGGGGGLSGGRKEDIEVDLLPLQC